MSPLEINALLDRLLLSPRTRMTAARLDELANHVYIEELADEQLPMAERIALELAAMRAALAATAINDAWYEEHSTRNLARTHAWLDAQRWYHEAATEHRAYTGYERTPEDVPEAPEGCEPELWAREYRAQWAQCIDYCEEDPRG